MLPPWRAVRAGRYAFLQQFAERYGGGDTSVQLFPNIVYSLALARWYQEQGEREWRLLVLILLSWVY